ncbi:MAG: DUF3800 domain-containing protein [Lachnospiraceae bacterium]|nr:DUF3800 domain-containing protein [Lachnospiraceae bacterium]
MKELSVFVDESGDFGEYENHAPYYIISLVLHDQKMDISENLNILEREMAYLGYPEHCIHVGPIIRKEKEYEYEDLEVRRKIVMRLMAFVRHIDMKFITAYIEKMPNEDTVQSVARLSKELSSGLRDNLSFFQHFDVIKVYYDNGQSEVTKIISSVFNALFDHVEVRKVMPAQYRLFQVADLVCTLELAELKMKKKMLSQSEELFFENERILRKNYLKPINQKLLNKENY